MNAKALLLSSAITFKACGEKYRSTHHRRPQLDVEYALATV